MYFSKRLMNICRKGEERMKKSDFKSKIFLKTSDCHRKLYVILQLQIIILQICFFWSNPNMWCFIPLLLHLAEKFIELKKQGRKPLVRKKRAEEVVIIVLVFLLILVLMLLEQQQHYCRISKYSPLRTAGCYFWQPFICCKLMCCGCSNQW